MNTRSIFEEEMENIQQLPLGYLKEGYFQSDEKSLRPEIIIDWAEEIARSLDRMSYLQLRWFYNKVCCINQRLEIGSTFSDTTTELLTLKRDAAYCVGRGDAPELFKVFIDCNVDLAAKDEMAFTKGFLEHFKSVIAYKRYWENKRRKIE